MVCAWLEEHGYRRDEIGSLTRGYVRRVVGWPRDDKGVLRQPPRDDDVPIDPESKLRAFYFRRGYPHYRIEAMVAEAMAEHDRRQAAGEPGLFGW